MAKKLSISIPKKRIRKSAKKSCPKESCDNKVQIQKSNNSTKFAILFLLVAGLWISNAYIVLYR